jgi:ribose/xylose/arabinose/galactoside ABC-type transport system permease subunit
MTTATMFAAGPTVHRSWMRTAAVLVLVAAVLGLLWAFAPNFFKLNNLINILVQAATLSVMAIGMAVVMIGGGIDLSLPFNAAVSAVLGAMYMRASGDAVGGSFIMLGAAAGIGLLNGVAVGYLKMIPFVVSLAMMSITSGSAVWLTNSISIANVPQRFVHLFRVRLFNFPVSVWIAMGVAAAATFLMGRSTFARQLYAVGISAKAARIARIPVQRLLAISYVAAGVAAGIAAMMLTGRLASASANLASPSTVLDVVSACVIGGVSIYGGAGKVWGAALGAVFVALLSNALNAAEVSLYVSQMIRGALIVGFVAFDRFSVAVGGR